MLGKSHEFHALLLEKGIYFIISKMSAVDAVKNLKFLILFPVETAQKGHQIYCDYRYYIKDINKLHWSKSLTKSTRNPLNLCIEMTVAAKQNIGSHL